MASGDICISTGWSGDYNVMRRRAKAAGKDYDIRYFTPKGATGLWFTMMGIPKDAANKEAAYKWINFLLQPEIAAEITNQITYPNAVPASKALIRPELANDPFLYPSEAALAEYFNYEPIEDDLLRASNKLWLRFKSGR
jgi:putrescine transport system substrate-binding protein